MWDLTVVLVADHCLSSFICIFFYVNSPTGICAGDGVFLIVDT